MIDSLAIARTASGWLGVPYRHQGRSRYGCDCAGLVVGVLAELGVDLRLPAYGPEGSGVDAARFIAQAGGQSIPIMDAGAGDLVAWRPPGAGLHLGLMGFDLVVHASASVGRVVMVRRRALARSVSLAQAWSLSGVDGGYRV